ncbi:TPA: hypothetical protein QCS32_004941 [Bacillus thuringiensis]|uniref:Uncharacterized protein n=2 Tax=Bacillus thuringiensis TaxID=1428 RepID=A0A9X6LNW3_BACTU|nr:hypothetical protein [Bacillus thuringiensis]MEB9624558.1 hypothetical protein [Bacillus cereus]OTW49378.1 hypothetical protein BK699_11635 [Bacillus thuringiensis serovar mexicanensis]OUB49607.1 hypothetical protein BK741_12035 [Bacillus thuringiensis serovar iberica]HDR5353184.1 hypothetical protein [Bacillus thuringiensis]
MIKAPEPNWQPISALPLIADMIDGQLEEAKEQYTTLLETQQKPYALDEYTVHRVIQVYTDQLEFVPIYIKQLKKWKVEAGLTSTQQKEIKRLQEQVRQWQQVLINILDLANKLKEETIEKVISKSDLELGIQSLKNRM